jgi:hypothetical protein
MYYVPSNARVEGFTFTGGGSSGFFGGLYLVSSSPLIINNVITANGGPDADAGGVFIYGGYRPTLTRNRIVGNQSGYIAALDIRHANVMLIQNVISGNSGVITGGLSLESSSITVSGNTISDNVSQWMAGGIYIQECGGPLQAIPSPGTTPREGAPPAGSTLTFRP